MVRPSATQRGYSYRWRLRSKHFLRAHPLCTMCAARGVTTLATCVDHVTPHKSDPALFWDESNWQPLCLACHSSRKQQAERKGYDATPGPDGYPTDPNHPFNQRRGGG